MRDLFLLILFFVSLQVLAQWGVYEFYKCDDGVEWEQHKADHKCKIVREISGSFFTLSKTCWKCDDGVEYCR